MTLRRIYLPAAIVIIVAVLYLVTSVGEGIDAYYRSRLVDMVHGTAWRPYVTRALVPIIARAMVALTPASVPRPEHVAVVLLMALSLFAFQSALRQLFTRSYVVGDAAPRLAALVGLAFLPMFFGPFSRQIYDFTTLWTFTLGLALMTSRQWPAYLALFAIATINKETSILLTLVFAAHFLWYRRIPISSAVVLIAAQVAIFVAIRGTISYIFRNNDGGVVEINWYNHNQQVLLDPSLMSKRLPMFAALALVGTWQWRHKAPLLRTGLVVLAPVLLAMGVTVGQVDEIRAYYEFYPIVIVLVADSVCRMVGYPIKSEPA